MYIKLLEQTVRELKGEEIEDEIRAAVNLKLIFGSTSSTSLT